MKTVFEILPSSFIAEDCTLLCEISNEGFSYCIKDEVKNYFLGLAMYHFDKSKPLVGYPIALQILFSQKEILSRTFSNVKIVYSLPQSVLVPFSLYNRDHNDLLMNTMHGDVDQHTNIFTDFIEAQSMYNCYRVPVATDQVVHNQYPEAETVHQYTLLIKTASMETDKLSVIFYTQKIVVLLIKDDQILLINTYNYQAPEDVSYVLLNICHQFNIADIHLEINGLLEQKSALYKELYKYFKDVSFCTFPKGITVAEEIIKYPSHYFSNIFAIDSCE